MDAITMLKDDHRAVEALFKRFEKSGDRAFTLKRNLADAIIEDLSKHAAIEEELFYPATRATVPEVEDIVLESIEEHHIVKWVLSEIEHLDPHEESFDAKVTVLIENVRHHVKEEESDYFPKVRKELGRKALVELGDAMASAKSTAPTHPHPRAPSTPPRNIAASNVAGVVDRVEDTMSELAASGAAALRGVIDHRSATRSRTQSKVTKGATDGAKTAEKQAKRVSRAAPSTSGRGAAKKAS
jgi:hemerythrin superfamily protein